MITVVFYCFILFSSTFFVWVSEKGHNRFDRLFFLTVAFFLVFIPAAIRYDIGTDYLNYLDIFQNELRLERYKFKEPLFYFINWFIGAIGLHFQWIFVTFAFIFTAVAFKAYPRKQAWLLHFLFFSMLWFNSFNIMRQAIALSWCLLALFYFFEKRYFTFFVLTLIASTFHRSALFITVAGCVALFPLNYRLKTYIMPLIFIGFIALTYVSMQIVLLYMEQILNFSGLTKYANYFHSAKHFITRDFGSGLGVIAKVLFSIYIILHTKQFLHINRNYWVLIILTFLYAIGVVLANNIIIFGRMADAFIIAPILGFFLIFQMQRNRKRHLIVTMAFLMFLTLTFIKEGMGAKTSYANPKRNPYQTILLR